jgi:hypothetical protein
MKDTISDNDLLLIRACKREKPSLRTMKRIVGRRYALHVKHVELQYVCKTLLKICLDYELIRDMEEFILFDINPKKWWTKEEKSFLDNVFDELVSVICCTEVKKFPRYRSSARFRNKYPD